MIIANQIMICIVHIITHSSPIWEIIVLAILKIVWGEAKYDFWNCVHNYFPNWMKMCVIAY